MTEPDWAGLREAVRDQLNATGLTPGEVAVRAGLSRETVRPILHAIPGNYRAPTLAKVSLAIGWTGDSIQRVLDGDAPQQTADTLAGQIQQLTDEVRSLNLRLADVERQLSPRPERPAP